MGSAGRRYLGARGSSVIITAKVWEELAAIAESLERERLDAENEILAGPRMLQGSTFRRGSSVSCSASTHAIGPRVSRTLPLGRQPRLADQ